jgi:hypothetical protein
MRLLDRAARKDTSLSNSNSNRDAPPLQVKDSYMSGTDLLSSLIPAATGLLGVWLGGFWMSRNQRKERAERRISDQLTEFYAPMLGMRERLSAKGKVRLKVSNVAHKTWGQAPQEEREKYDKIIEYNNRQLIEVDIPLYKQMVDLFTAKMHLAEPSTRTHFPILVEFVEMWDRSFAGALPRDVAERVGANEDTLTPFYSDLQINFERLRSSLFRA